MTVYEAKCLKTGDRVVLSVSGIRVAAGSVQFPTMVGIRILWDGQTEPGEVSFLDADNLSAETG